MGKLNIDLGKVLATQGGKNAILVIDDSNIARKTLAKNLEYYGFEIFEALSTNEKFKPIPVIALSAGAIQADIDKALEMGFYSYLVKPLQNIIGR